MRKGFIFTLDAFIAIAIVILAISVLAMAYRGEQTDIQALKSIEGKVLENSIYGFHLSKAAGDVGLVTAISSSDEFGYCYKTFNYDVSSGTLSEEKYCGVMQK